MITLLCRNRVSDFDRWNAVFSSHAAAHRAAGLSLINVWQSIEEPTNVFFLFRVESIERAREFMNTPGAAAAGATAGVIDGEYHFITEAEGYPA